jgi:hypothetical protein
VQLPKDAKELNIGLSRDGKTFYTYENNTLIHWNMNPVQIIDSVKITDPRFSSPMNYDLVPDRTKIIFSDRKTGIGLLDLTTKQFIKKIPMQFRFDKLVGTNLITVDLDRTITVRDLENLNAIKQQKISTVQINCDECSDDVWLLLKSNDGKNLAIITNLRILLFDTNELKVVSEIKGFFPDNGTYLSLSNNGEIIEGSEVLFNLSTLKLVGAKNYASNVTTKELLNIKHALFWYRKKVNKPYVDSSTNILGVLKDKKIYQFQDGNWLIITSDAHFDGSPEARRYFTMKTSSGESMPIDDATFQKYHTQINLKD